MSILPEMNLVDIFDASKMTGFKFSGIPNNTFGVIFVRFLCIGVEQSSLMTIYSGTSDFIPL